MLPLQAAFPKALGPLLWVWIAQLPPDVTCAPPGAGLEEVADLQSEQPPAKGKPAGESETKPGRVEPAELPAVICPLLRQEQYLHFWVACCVAGAEWLC